MLRLIDRLRMDALVESSARLEPYPGLRKHPEPPGPLFQFGDPVGFEWNTYEIEMAHLPPEFHGLRIVHITDTHCRPEWKRAYDDVNDRIAASTPDLILFTGDLVDDRMRPGRAVGIGKRFVRGWNAHLGTFGVRGNHDLRLPLARFADGPLRFIEGQCVSVRRGDAELELIGLTGPEHLDFPPSKLFAIPPRRVGVPRVVLSHYPDHIRRCRAMDADVFLAGHTHGGQVCLPGLLPIDRHDSLLWRYTRGVHWFDGRWLVVGRGLGFSMLPIRLLCPAEIIELILVPRKAVDGGAP